MNFQELGQMLREERERQGLSLDDVMETTKISRMNLEALENGDSKALPHAVYAKGFIRSYARVLKLDADELMSSVEAEVNDACDDGVPQPPGAVLSSKQTIRETPSGCEKKGKGGRWLIIILLLGLAVLAAFLFTSKLVTKAPAPVATEQAAPEAEQPAAPEIATPEADQPAPPATEQQAAPVDAATPEADAAATDQGAEQAMAETPAPEPPAEQAGQTDKEQDAATGTAAPDEIKYTHNLVIRATTDTGCWIGVWRGDEEKMYRNYVLAKGEPLNLMFNTPRRIRIGNVAGVEVTYNGKPYPLDGARGNITTLRFGMDDQ